MCLLIVYSYKLCGWPPPLLPHSVWMVVPSYAKQSLPLLFLYSRNTSPYVFCIFDFPPPLAISMFSMFPHMDAGNQILKIHYVFRFLEKITLIAALGVYMDVWFLKSHFNCSAWRIHRCMVLKDPF